MPSRTLLLCFIHGFKGSDDTFKNFPQDLQEKTASTLPDHRVESIIYPKYETKGELAEATAAFLEWLKERVMEVRKKHSETPWPPNDDNVGVVLVAHSMGGFVAADALFLTLNERAASSSSEDAHPFPLIQGILTFDTPYNGLARSMFVYGAFSNYSKVNSVFSAMTALSAAAPMSLGRLGARNVSSLSASSARSSSSTAKWALWQTLAVRTGTVGAIAAGGVAAFWHRDAIIAGLKKVKANPRESITSGYQQSADSLSQGLAYINRGNVGKSFAWLSDHFTFVGALMKQKELDRRLQRLAALKGVGVHDYYCSLGPNGYWSGGYFIPERTFCAIPEADQDAAKLFSRCVMSENDDEIQAHLNLFRKDKHDGYEALVEESTSMVKGWFLSDVKLFDDPQFQEKDPQEKEEHEAVEKALEDANVEDAKATDADTNEKKEAETSGGNEGEQVPDESPLDIAAASTLTSMPEQGGDQQTDSGEAGEVSEADAEAVKQQQQSYLQHLMRIAQGAGTGVRGWSDKMPAVSMPAVNMPQMPGMPAMPGLPSMPSVPAMPKVSTSLPSVSMPKVGLFSRKGAATTEEDKKEEATKEGEEKKEEVKEVTEGETGDAEKKEELETQTSVDKGDEASKESTGDSKAVEDVQQGGDEGRAVEKENASGITEAPQEAEQAPKEASQGSQDTPQASQDTPQASQDDPQASQEADKTTQGADKPTQEANETIQEAPQVAHETFEAPEQAGEVATQDLQAMHGQDAGDAPAEQAKDEKHDEGAPQQAKETAKEEKSAEETSK